MYMCKVGNDFKVDFFKRSLNFCYDKKEGIVYSSDIEIFEKLGLSTQNIFEEIEKQQEVLNSSIVRSICKEMIDEVLETIEVNNRALSNQILKVSKEKEELILTVESVFNGQLQALKNNIDFVTKDKVVIENSIKGLAQCYEEMLDIDESKEKTKNETFSTLKNSISILNKKIKESKESIESLNVRFEAVLDLISQQVQQQQNSKKMPNIMKSGITLERIWNSVEDKNSAAILSIMLMIKKFMEDKGNKF